MRKKPDRQAKARFTAIFIATVFCIMSVTTLLVGFFSRVIFESPIFGTRHIPYQIQLLIFTAMCILIGTVLSVIFSRIVIKPLDELFSALNRVIEGDYTVKVKPRGIKRSQRLGKRFNHLTEELQSISTLNEDFVHNFSHEFKTPITSIQGFAKLIRNEHISEEKRNEYLDIIIRESERLAQLSGNALLFTKIESWTSAGNTELLNLTEDIRQTVVMLEPKWNTKNIVFDLEGEDFDVEYNRELMSHVWMNILDNAVKFSKENGEIKISITKQNDTVKTVITDNGIGMARETMSNIFNKFYQGDRSHSTTGNGLGLPITKKIIELHGGRILVESEENKGTSITVILPVKQ